MDEFFIFLIVVIGLVLYLLRLSSRISALEKQLGVHGQPVPSTAPVSPSQLSAPDGLAPIPPAHQYTPESTKPNAFIEWVKQDFLVKLGGLLLLIALGWFVSYAFANNWIGPAGRITIGILVGLIFLIIGAVRIRRFKHQGSIFAVLGSATVILTLFAAREMYDFFTPATSLILMFLSVTYVAFLSVRFSAPRLAIAGLLLAAVSPVLTAAPEPEALNLFLYLAVIVLGSLWVVFITGWSVLTPIALFVVAAYSAPFLVGYGISVTEQDLVLLFTFGFTALFFVTNVISTIRRPFKHHLPAQVLTAVFSIVYLVAWIMEAVSDSLQSLVFVIWALVFAVGAYLVFVATSNRVVFYLYGAMAIGLIGAATAAELSGPALTIAFIIEAGLILILVAALRSPLSVIRATSLVFIIPGLLALDSIDSRAWRDSIIHSDFVVVTLFTVALAMVSVLLYHWSGSADDRQTRSVSKVFFVATTAFAAAWIWLTFHALFDVAGTTISLVLYTIIGLSAFVFGQQTGVVLLRYTGAVFIGGVVLRLLLVDIWDMPLTGRIITFFIIGVMLVSTAFIGKNKSVNQHEV
jgi:uncharacterized membrane protein